MADAKEIQRKLQENLAWHKENGSSPEEVQAEIAKAQAALSRISATDPERQRSALEDVGAGAQTFADAATLGASGLADDALSSAFGGGGFAERRASRKENKEAFRTAHPKLATTLEVAGSVAPAFIPGAGLGRTVGTAAARAIPAGRGAALSLARRGAGQLARSGVADAALQSGVGGAVGELDDLTLDELGGALKSGAQSGAVGGLAGGILGRIAGGSVASANRLQHTGRLDKRAVALAKEMQGNDAVNYPRALGQAATPLTREMQAVLSHRDILPVVREIRGYDRWHGVKVNDPKFLDAVYKNGLSDWGKQIEAAIETAATSDVKKANALREQLAQVNGLKTRFLDAMDAQVPGYRDAVVGHATKRGELKALERGADIGQSIGSGKHIKGKNLRTETPAGFIESIDRMGPAEAEMALTGVLGRTGEQIRLSGNPLTTFNVIPSAVRVPLYVHRNKEVVRALEKKLGRGNLGRSTEAATRGSLARFLGVEAGR